MLQGNAGQHLVTAGGNDVVSADRRHALTFQPVGQIVGPGVAQAADEYGIVLVHALACHVDDQAPGVNPIKIYPSVSQCGEDQFLLNPHARTQNA